MSNEPTPLLEVKNLTKHFPAAHGQKVHAFLLSWNVARHSVLSENPAAVKVPWDVRS